MIEFLIKNKRLLNLKGICELSGVNYNTFQSKARLGYEFTPIQEKKIRELLETLIKEYHE